MGLYNRVTGFADNQTKREGSRNTEPESFKPMRLEQAFNKAYKSYRINGRPRMDVDTFFS